MRMSMRRFTRLTNGFSKKAINHSYSVAIHFMHYNSVRIHQSLRITPAMRIQDERKTRNSFESLKFFVKIPGFRVNDKEHKESPAR